MSSIGAIDVELTIVVGSAKMPLHQLLSLGRGAVIPLGGDAAQPLRILANGLSVAEGAVLLDGERVKVAVSSAS